MKKGYVRVTNQLIKDALGFPGDWEIEEVNPYIDNGCKVPGQPTMIISGSDFPEINNRGEAEEVTINIHKEAIRFEIKKI